MLGKAVVPMMVLVQAASWEPSELPHPRSSGAKTGSRKPRFPPIIGAVNRGVINKDGIYSPIELNSRYAMTARIKITLPRRNQEKQWTQEFSLKIYFP